MIPYKTLTGGGKSSDDFHPEVPFIVMPKVKLVGNMYKGEDGKEYLPELFDRFFKSVKTNIKGKLYKGDLIGNNWVD